MGKNLAGILYDGLRTGFEKVKVGFNNYAFPIAAAGVLATSHFLGSVGTSHAQAPDSSYADSLDSGKTKSPKKTIYDLDLDKDIPSSERFRYSMNLLEDSFEKKMIIAKYSLARKIADSEQLRAIHKLNVGSQSDIEQLTELFHKIFLKYDTNSGTYHNEFFDTLEERVRYADNIRRGCFHHTSNKHLDVPLPPQEMLDDYGQDIIKLGYIVSDEDRVDETNGDLLGSVRDKPKDSNFPSFDEKIHVKFPGKQRIEKNYSRGPPTNFEWVDKDKTPESQRAESETGIVEVNLIDSIPHLKEEDALVYFLPEPDESRRTFKGRTYFSLDPRPFVVDRSGEKRLVGKIIANVYGPDGDKIIADTVSLDEPAPEEIKKEDRLTFSLPTSKPIYSLGGRDGEFQYAIDVLTSKDDPKKGGGAGSVFIDVDGMAPTYFGHVGDDMGYVKIPPVAESGDSLRLVFDGQLVSHDKRITLPKRDSTRSFPLQYVVKFNRLSSSPKNKSKKGDDLTPVVPSSIFDFLINETIKTGSVPDSFTVPWSFFVKRKGRDIVSKIDPSLSTDSIVVRDTTFPTSPDLKSQVRGFLAENKEIENAVYVDTLYGYMQSVTGKHDIKVPLPDSVFKEGDRYNVTVLVNPKNPADRLVPQESKLSKTPLSYQKGVVKDVRIIKNIPGKREKRK